MRWRRPTQLSVKFSVPFVGEVAGVWAPAEAERGAAWELYVELVTRVTVVELDPEEGLLREALTSFYTLFDTTRTILRRYGPAVAPRRSTGQLSFGELALTVLNGAVRPVTEKWHPRLSAYESQRPADVDPVEYERRWEHAADLRADLARTRQALGDLAEVLADVANAAHIAGRAIPKQVGGSAGDHA
jgi:hypothetical protein